MVHTQLAPTQRFTIVSAIIASTLMAHLRLVISLSRAMIACSSLLYVPLYLFYFFVFSCGVKFSLSLQPSALCFIFYRHPTKKNTGIFCYLLLRRKHTRRPFHLFSHSPFKWSKCCARLTQDAPGLKYISHPRDTPHEPTAKISPAGTSCPLP